MRLLSLHQLKRSFLPGLLLFTVVACGGKKDAPEANGKQGESSLDVTTGSIINGRDNRAESNLAQQVAELNNLSLSKAQEFVNKSQSVAGMVERKHFEYSGGRYHFLYQNRTLGAVKNLCSGERFRGQNVLPTCSGFLVGDDILVTAGHCITESSCSQKSWVFGYDLPKSKSRNLSFGRGEFYHCKKVLRHKLSRFKNQDWAVVQLDRKVTGRKPLPFRTEGKIRKHDDVVVIGHPSGLPKKISGGARVVRTGTRVNSFTASLDTFGGNSGSPIFNQATGIVEGILVQGDVDYETTRSGCQVVNVNRDGEYYAREKVMRIRKVDLEDFVDSYEEPSRPTTPVTTRPTTPRGPQVLRDVYEPNDRAAQGIRVDGFPFVKEKLSIYPTNDRDIFKVHISEKGELEVQLKTKFRDGDLDFRLFDRYGDLIHKAESENNKEELRKEVLPGVYYVLIYGYEGATGAYDLKIDFEAESKVQYLSPDDFKVKLDTYGVQTDYRTQRAYLRFSLSLKGNNPEYLDAVQKVVYYFDEYTNQSSRSRSKEFTTGVFRTFYKGWTTHRAEVFLKDGRKLTLKGTKIDF